MKWLTNALGYPTEQAILLRKVNVDAKRLVELRIEDGLVWSVVGPRRDLLDSLLDFHDGPGPHLSGAGCTQLN